MAHHVQYAVIDWVGAGFANYSNRAIFIGVADDIVENDLDFLAGKQLHNAGGTGIQLHTRC